MKSSVSPNSSRVVDKRLHLVMVQWKNSAKLSVIKCVMSPQDVIIIIIISVCSKVILITVLYRVIVNICSVSATFKIQM